MGKVILICGKICSGKTYYANQIKQKERAVILSTDEVTYDLTDNAQGENYEKFAERVNVYLMKKASELAGVGCNVILDWGFWTRSGRREVTAFFTTKGIPVEWHYIDVDDETWYKNIAYRNEKIANGEGGSDFYVDEGLLRKVLSRFEVPDRADMDVWHRSIRADEGEN